jgi:hypothetical protein
LQSFYPLPERKREWKPGGWIFLILPMLAERGGGACSVLRAIRVVAVTSPAVARAIDGSSTEVEFLDVLGTKV